MYVYTQREICSDTYCDSSSSSGLAYQDYGGSTGVGGGNRPGEREPKARIDSVDMGEGLPESILKSGWKSCIRQEKMNEFHAIFLNCS